MDTQWLNHPSLQKMDPAKKQIVLDFIKETEGKPVEKAMKSVATANAKLKAMNLFFTQEETDLITNIIMSKMSAPQRNQAEMMKNMLNKQNQKRPNK